ncbi:MAG: HAD-IA family hydrolase [Acidimicrobiia bacterium]|nr:HAD-IA family hydrolase [Acidimicrobiia bacterium]
MIRWQDVDAALFDLDGVLTPTALVHEKAWGRAFNGFLDHAGDSAPFTRDDYLQFVDGKPRYDGVRSFVESRSIELAEGAPADAAGYETVCALGNLKNELFNEVLRNDGVDPYPDALVLLDVLDTLGVAMAVVSSSANAGPVLDAAGISSRFVYRMDGLVARRDSIPGKPAPDMFLETARRIGVEPGAAVVLEDAVSGVRAGASGGFQHVVGVDREGNGEALAEAGATIIVSSLAALVVG